jgi:integrase
MRVKLTPAFVAKPPVPEKDRVVYWDATQKGLGLVVTKAGHRSWVIQYRNGARESCRMTPAAPGFLGLADARKWARAELGKVAHGRDPLAEKRRAALAGKNTFAAVCEEYFKREGAKLRTAQTRRATLERLVLPVLGKREIGEIKRSEINRLLDKIEDDNGPRAAGLALAYFNVVCNWHAGRDDDFRNPVVRGMSRGAATRRDRILSDSELAAVWKAAQAEQGPFGALVCFLLLTAARRGEAVGLRRSELDGANWLLPAARNKTKVDLVRPLSAAAQAVLDRLPRIGDFVFSVDGRRPLGGLSARKAQFDEACGVRGWRVHDLRRTARSLLSRARIDSDIGERCLGHLIPGVRAVYDHHRFHDEMKAAFEALASQIDRVVNPPTENVLPFPATVVNA